MYKNQEVTSSSRAGKSYTYQAPESAPKALAIGGLKDRILADVGELIDALSAATGTNSAPANVNGTHTTGTGNGGASAGAATTGESPQGAAGTSAGGSYGGVTAGGSYGGATRGGVAPVAGPANGGGASATGEAPGLGGSEDRPAAGDGGAATGQGSSEEATQLLVEREHYMRDRARETARRAMRTKESAATRLLVPSYAESATPVALSKHRSDSNRAPLIEAREFSPFFGTRGRSNEATRERMSVPSSRPETVPATGIVSSGRPIDAYWASFGTAVERAAARINTTSTMLEAIIGTDDRTRVTSNQVYPWRCICSLLITAANNTSWIGTGWLVSPRLVLTAGHCVYMTDQDGWASRIEVIPGRDGSARPFGSAVARDFRSVTGWTQDSDSEYDYGAILLPPDARYGEQLGWFGFASRSDDHLRRLTLNLSGYPGDGGPARLDGTQWYHSRGVRDVTAKQISYEIDTFGGQSGAPVWEYASDGSRYGVAIHTYGTSVSNGATRITQDVFNNIVSWASQAP